MNIIIISPYFYPLNNPRAHRWTSLAVYWADMGHSVVVFTSNNSNVSTHDINLHQNIRIEYLGPHTILPIAQKAKSVGFIYFISPIMSFFKSILRFFWKRFYWPDSSFLWYFLSKNLIKEHICNNPVDRMYTVSLPYTCHVIGLSLKKKFPNLWWGVDIGDPFYFSKHFKINNRWLYNRLNKYIEGKIVAAADKLYVTNEVLKTQYLSTFYCEPKKIDITLPLLHDKTFYFIPNKRKKQDPIKILMGGRFYNIVRPSLPVLTFIHRFFEKYPESIGKIIFNLYTELDESTLTKKLIRDLQHSVQVFPIISKTLMQELYNQHHFILHISNLSKNQIPSKLPEIISTGLPIVNFTFALNDPLPTFLNNEHLIVNIPILDKENENKNLEIMHNFIISSASLNTPSFTVDNSLKPYKLEYISEQYLAP